MKLLEKIRSGIVRKVALAAALILGFLGFLGAGVASAHPRVVAGRGAGGPVAVRGYIAPAPYYGPVYARPRYGYVARRECAPRDARFHRKRYR